MIRFISVLIIIAWITFTEMRLAALFGRIEEVRDMLGLDSIVEAKKKIRTVEMSDEHKRELTEKLIELLKEEEKNK